VAKATAPPQLEPALAPTAPRSGTDDWETF
jgi:hypothetical protein